MPKVRGRPGRADDVDLMIRARDLAAFAGAACFLLAGLWVAGFPLHLLLRGERSGGPFWLMCVSIGLFSLSFGVAILAIALRSLRRRREAAGAHGGRADGRRGVIPAQAGLHLRLFGFIVWQWNLFGGFLLSILLSRRTSSFGERTMVTVWLLVGAALLLLFIYQLLSVRKSGRSEFHMHRGCVGGVLEGQIETRARLEPASTLRLRLECLTQTSHPASPVSGAPPVNSENILWLAEATVAPARLAWNGHRTAIPVRFAIPADCLPTGAADGWQPVSWRLVAEAGLPGLDYFAAFDVPVAGPDAATTSPQRQRRLS